MNTVDTLRTYRQGSYAWYKAVCESNERYIDANVTVRIVGGLAIIKLHDTDIVAIHQDGTIILRAGKWRTALTKSTINSHIPPTVRVRMHKGVWWVDAPNGVHRFEDGIRLDKDGNVLPYVMLDEDGTLL